MKTSPLCSARTSLAAVPAVCIHDSGYAMTLTAVAIDAQLLTGPGPDDTALLAINRLLWGGIRVSVLQQHHQEPGGPVPGALPCLPDQVQLLTYDPHDCDTLTACLNSWQATAPSTPHSDAPPGNTPEQEAITLGLVCSNQSHEAWMSCLGKPGSPQATLWRVPCQGAAQPACCHTDNPTQQQQQRQLVCVDLPSLAQLPRAIALHQQQSCGPGTLVVAYTMAPKRERELAGVTSAAAAAAAATAAATHGTTATDNTAGGQRPQHAYTGGLLCLVPQQGLLFMPLDLDEPLDDQLPFQVVLHKASDELELGGDGRPRFSARVLRLKQWLTQHPEVRVVDPLDCTAKVIDRVALCQLLDRLQPCATGQDQVVVRAPAYAVVQSLAGGDEELLACVQSAGLTPPFIVKPAEACGLPHSHRMALVLSTSALGGALRAASVCAPCVVQEFRNHGGRVAKVYVAGSKVFHTTRPSIPDVPTAWLGKLDGSPTHDTCNSTGQLPQSCNNETSPPQHSAAAVAPTLVACGFHVFDSLKSLPTTSWVQEEPTGQAQGAVAADTSVGSSAAVQLSSVLEAQSQVLEELASQLRNLLGLTLFGFDVIAVPIGTEQPQGPVVSLQVIDVNFLPNYRVAGAANHVWDVIRS